AGFTGSWCKSASSAGFAWPWKRWRTAIVPMPRSRASSPRPLHLTSRSRCCWRPRSHRLSARETPTGSVDFYVGGGYYGSAELAGGLASLSADNLAIGESDIYAIYSGDATNDPSTSDTIQEHVLANDTSTSTPGVSPGTIYWTQDVTLSPTVTASGTPVEGLSGPVYFYIDDSYVGYANVDASGVATFTVSNVPAGSHAVTAAFQGDGVFEPSTSAASSLTVLTNGSSISTPSVSPSTIYWTQDVTLSATVTPSGTPVEGLTGPVYFYVDDGYVGYANVDPSGVATLTVSNVPVGSHAVIAAYQ